MDKTLQRSVVEAWQTGNVEVYVQLHRAAVLAGDLTGAFLMSGRLWVEVENSGGILDRLFHRLKNSFTDSEDSLSDHERRAWAAYHVGKGCLRASKVETGIRWLNACLENSDGLEKLKLDCLLEIEEGYRGWNPEKVVEISQQAVDIAISLGNLEHLVAALYRLAGGLESLGYVERKWMVVHDLRNLSQFFSSSTNPAMYHFASTLYRVCQGESLHMSDQNEAAYEEFTCGLTHLQFLPELNSEMQKYLNFQRDGRGFWPSKCELAVGVGVHLSARLGCLRMKLGKEATEDEKSLDQYLAATKTIFKSVNTVNLQDLRKCLNDSLAQNSLEDAESYGAELLKAAVTDEMAKYKTAAIDALQGLAIICYQYHAANFRGNEAAFQIVDSFLREAEALALSSEVTSYLKLRRDRAFYTGKYGESGDWKNVVQDDLHHILEMERRAGPASDERIQLLQNAREFFDDIQFQYLERSDPGPQFKQALLWAERGRSRDMLHHLAVENGSELFDMALFDGDDDWGWKEVRSVCCRHKTSVFLLFSRPGDDIYSYFLHADDEPECVKASIGIGIKQCFETLHATLLRAGEEERRLRQGLLTLFYGILIQPWDEKLEKIKPARLVIVPTKELCSVPFSALRVPESNLDLSKKVHLNRDDIAELCTGEEPDEYLVEKYEIVVAPSLRMFNYCEQRREALLRRRDDGGNLQALLVINPTEDLSEAENEASEVESCLSSCGFEVKHLEKKEATRQAVGEALKNSHWAHFATHGYLDDKFRRGALLLASEPGEAGLFEHVTGVRLVLETLNCAEVTVLSSCTSGIGLDNYPEGNLGLHRSFHMAGVPTCVASLWKVYDSSTKTLMEYFYRSLVEGACVSKAMQEAMKLMIHADDEMTGEPKYDVTDWAAFYVSGAASSAL